MEPKLIGTVWKFQPGAVRGDRRNIRSITKIQSPFSNWRVTGIFGDRWYIGGSTIVSFDSFGIVIDVLRDSLYADQVDRIVLLFGETTVVVNFNWFATVASRIL